MRIHYGHFAAALLKKKKNKRRETRSPVAERKKVLPCFLSRYITITTVCESAAANCFTAPPPFRVYNICGRHSILKK